ncbi:hypothetical protein [Leptolyngbya sp. 7M]|uniref:hypothetical protein n=1 Tax=Leptolyngbya sp. 7M TaxID=2812896 RepID=UPI001B8DA3D1|nr:hypothetical protein [Leptolyngbya sp. 7M]QYO68022.1 hypothetical protein JVX88_15345 [Leptolyngbya sp. 7M]
MHRTRRSFAIIFLCFSLTAIVSAQKQWIGTYEFNEDGGTTAGGTPIQVLCRKLFFFSPEIIYLNVNLLFWMIRGNPE